MIFSPVRVVRARLPSSSFIAYLSQILQLGSSIDITADIELDVMGDTKEAILEHQEQVSREKECQNGSMNCTLGHVGQAKTRNGKPWPTTSNRYRRKSRAIPTPEPSGVGLRGQMLETRRCAGRGDQGQGAAQART
jgi:hypothetical protein